MPKTMDIEKQTNKVHEGINYAYNEWVEDISRRYNQSQVRAAVGINTEQLRFYWTLGRDIVNLHIEERWGQGIINQLSRDLTNKLDRKGFSVTSLGYMKRFYQLYPDAIPTLPPAGGEMHALTNLPQLRANYKVHCFAYHGATTKPLLTK